ncbi:MAG TPA: trypsin-like peptidase domain-containing protein [Anaeromyxobacteraceae bacterium]|nr:trypsin-like peptidase domain-containing protein [Anaeromyxobacteraceae bacterium]
MAGSRRSPPVARSVPLPAVLAALVLAAPILCAGPARAEAPRPGGGPLLQELSASIAQLAAKVSPAVVQIRVTGYGPVGDPAPGEAPLVSRRYGVGSGVIVDPDGWVLTNAHVVHGAQRIQVVVPGRAEGPGSQRQRIFEARVVGAQASIDLALLRIDAKGLPTLPLEKDVKVRQGELVFAVGSPQGLASTVTMGVVSSAARQIDEPTPLAIPMLLIQTDAPINPGNSGGPLVNSDGVLVGINTFILSQSGGSQGLGFAIPAPMARFAYESLRKFGRVRRIEAGVTAVAINPVLAAGLGLPRDWGVVVSDVSPAGAAHAGGLQPGDVIDSFDGHPIDSLPALTGALFLHPVGAPVEMVVLRGDRRLVLRIDAPEAPEPVDRLADLANPDTGLVARLGILGVDVGERVRGILPPLRIGSGVVVAARTLGTAAVTSGLQPGDVIHRVNGATIESVEALRNALEPLRSGAPVVLHVERQGHLAFLAFEIE